MAVVSYTFDLGEGVPNNNLYYILNKELQKRGTSQSKITIWKDYLFYLQSGLSKIPNKSTTVYRGIPAEQKERIEKEYIKGRKIYWSSYSSTSSSLSQAKHFTEPGGIIFEISIYSGKSIKNYSFLPQEDEILLSPNMKFTVSSDLFKGKDGYWYLKMVQNLKDVKAFVF